LLRAKIGLWHPLPHHARADAQNLCQNRADKLGIRTARLPIGTYLAEMPTRKVLTVNQVSSVSRDLRKSS
jgi:hypothetical protein